MNNPHFIPHGPSGRPAPVSAFSLVEVVMALAVMSYAMVGILALLPLGIRSASDSIEETEAINIPSEVIADRQSTPAKVASNTYHVPPLDSGATDYFGISSDGMTYVPKSNISQARYRVEYTIIPATGGTLQPHKTQLRVSWPAGAAQPTGKVEILATFSQP